MQDVEILHREAMELVSQAVNARQYNSQFAIRNSQLLPMDESRGLNQANVKIYP